MAWWKLFWNPVAEAESRPDIKIENLVSEPVRSIVKAMIDNRKRFITQTERLPSYSGLVTYEVLDMETEEYFFVCSFCLDRGYQSKIEHFGPSWAMEHEIKWAVDTLSAHYGSLRDRSKRINTARERNRLIEIYA